MGWHGSSADGASSALSLLRWTNVIGQLPGYVDYSIVAQLRIDPGAGGLPARRNLRHPTGACRARDCLCAAPSRLRRGSLRSRRAQHGRSSGGGYCRRDRYRSRDANRLPAQRAYAAQERAGRHGGRGIPMREAAKRIAGWEGQVNSAVSNSPRSCVISGDTEAVRQIMAELERDGVFCRAVKVDVASHSPQMEEAAASLASRTRRHDHR